MLKLTPLFAHGSSEDALDDLDGPIADAAREFVLGDVLREAHGAHDHEQGVDAPASGDVDSVALFPGPGDVQPGMLAR